VPVQGVIVGPVDKRLQPLPCNRPKQVVMHAMLDRDGGGAMHGAIK